MKSSTRHRTRSRAPARRTAQLATQLPTLEQVAQARSELDEVIAAVRALRKTLDSIPTSDGPPLVATGRASRTGATGVRGARELCDLINSWL